MLSDSGNSIIRTIDSSSQGKIFVIRLNFHCFQIKNKTYNFFCIDIISMISSIPSILPTLSPSYLLSRVPTTLPSPGPSVLPSRSPTDVASQSPSVCPSTSPILTPTLSPSYLPSLVPTTSPSQSSSLCPSRFPSVKPSPSPSLCPSVLPTVTPTWSPSFLSSRFPTVLSSPDPRLPLSTDVITYSYVSTFAGSGMPLVIDGISTKAGFKFPTGLAIDRENKFLYVIDSYDKALRQIEMSTRYVRTLQLWG